jgi:hypothetical protein
MDREIMAELTIIKNKLDYLDKTLQEALDVISYIKRSITPVPMEIDRRPLNMMANDIPLELDSRREPTYGSNYIPQAPGGKDRRKGGAK